jgi:alkylated DNA repair protein (DNA oxidative demethylase)
MAHGLFDKPPEGFEYVPDMITEVEERELVEQVAALPFYEVKMHGITAKRRVKHFGWVYGYTSWQIEPGPPLPEFLHPLRDRAAALVGVAPDLFAEVLVTDYPCGAGIGWHRDAPMFGPVVVGVSLAGSCRFRFQRNTPEGRETFAHLLEPRSAYVLSGPARWTWQHCIPPGKTRRYSITFRTVPERVDQPTGRTGRKHGERA